METDGTFVRRCSSSAVKYIEDDGEIVLLDLGKGLYFGLNETCSFIWTTMTPEGIALTSLASIYSDYWSVPEEVGLQDCIRITNELRALSLVETYFA